MRLSLWQQWSSNHSANFTVVGVFSTIEAANRAAKELRRIVSTIGNWFAENEQEVYALLKASVCLTPSPPERRFATEYGVKWCREPIDWLMYTSDEEMNAAVTVSGEAVFVTNEVNTTNTGTGPSPFDALMKRLGATSVTVDNEYGPLIIVTLTCRAPDATTASHVYEELKRYLEHPTTTPAPWAGATDIVFSPGYSKTISFSAYGSISRNRKRLSFKGEFGILAYGLPAMIAYFQQLGFSDINFTFTEIGE